jgi:uncharacterized membrane protein
MTLSCPTILAAGSSIRLEFMSWWVALLIFLALAAYVLVLGRRSLNGLGPARKWVAITIRLCVVLVFVLLLAGLRIQRQHKALEVWVLRDISDSTDLVDKAQLPAGKNVQQAVEDYLKDAARDNRKKAEDRIAVISFQDQAVVDALPSSDLKLDTVSIRERGHGTDASSAINLALASMSPDTMHRIVLITDANNNAGDIDAAVASAKSQGIPIDVMPLMYNVQNAVMIERFIAPTWQRENEPFNLTVIVRFTGNKPIEGTLQIDHKTDVHTDPIGDPIHVRLDPNANPEHQTAVHIRVPALRSAGVHRFIAKFTPDPGSLAAAGGTVTADIDKINQAAEAFVFVKGEQQILFVDNYRGNEGHYLRHQLIGAKVNLKTCTLDQFPKNLVELQNYDAVILGNVPHGSEGMSQEQDQHLARYVHDLGGGLIMLGGEDSFGAGGWQGSKVAEVLPVDMEVPAQRQVGKGALVLVMHSCEIPDGSGTYWGQQCALQAIRTLSSQDEIGIVSYNWNGANGGGANWDFVLQEKGNGQSVNDAAKKMKLGDMPSFDDALNVALNGKAGEHCLIKSNARHKHVIIISDGDPQKPQVALMNQYKTARISISTVSVYPHAGQNPPAMQEIPGEAGGPPFGKVYGPINSNNNQLPQIFIKEATIVRRSLIQENKDGMAVKLVDASDSIVAGMDASHPPPPVTGMILTSAKQDPRIVMSLASGKLNDPILAHWQAGLGKTLVFTSEPTTAWGKNWLEWPGFQEFWRRAVATVVRPAMSGDFDVQTTVNGTKGKIVVTGIGKDQKFLDFLKVDGFVLAPDGTTAIPVHLDQTGAGTYQAEFTANDPGSYVVGLSYGGQGADGKPIGGILRGGVAVNSQPEFRDLQSNDAKLAEIAERTGGRLLDPWDAKNANFFSRDKVAVSASPLPVFDILLPILLGLILLDVALRRIAWDWASMKRMALTAGNKVRSFTSVRKVKSRETLDALRRVREEVAETKFRPAEGAGGLEASAPPPLPSAPAPNASAKFEAPAGVEGDITQVVGGASDKPIPAAPKKVQPKGGTGKEEGGYTSSLLEAKRRAQQQIKRKEEGP